MQTDPIPFFFLLLPSEILDPNTPGFAGGKHSLCTISSSCLLFLLLKITAESSCLSCRSGGGHGEIADHGIGLIGPRRGCRKYPAFSSIRTTVRASFDGLWALGPCWAREALAIRLRRPNIAGRIWGQLHRCTFGFAMQRVPGWRPAANLGAVRDVSNTRTCSAWFAAQPSPAHTPHPMPTPPLPIPYLHDSMYDMGYRFQWFLMIGDTTNSTWSPPTASLSSG
jgi:hypothetical protein